ncbi:WhiB family transcriptional regulator [Kitasatospora sp. NPDC086791]|uniref:WhiB family transcriptional regulator n=1 Tax=Kitasatospora sp. NPDC086791 TaxID=3155178 RepID=UPI0034437787
MRWGALGACCDEEIDGDLFYPVSYTSPEGRDQVEEARKVCGRCPVAAACLQDALDREGQKDTKSRHGICGGRTPRERYLLSKTRRFTPAA